MTRPEPQNSPRARRTAWQTALLTPERSRVLHELRNDLRNGVHHEYRSLRLDVFSSTTWRPLERFLEGALLLEGIRPEFAFHEYQGMAAALADDSRQFETSLIAWDDEESYGALYDPTHRFTAADATALRDRFAHAIRLLAGRSTRVLWALPPPAPPLPHPLDHTAEGSTLGRRVVRLTEQLIEDLVGTPGAEPVDLTTHLAPLGTHRARDARRWELGRIQYSDAGFLAISEAIAPRLLLAAGVGIKAVIVDLDNTVWGGVLGEDGAAGLDLGGEYPGTCFRAFQKEIRRWKKAGCLLAAASKNDRGEALAAIDGHPEMILRARDFDHFEIHWEPKTHSVERILQAFNIAPDAVLFLDDNPRERAAVAQAFPTLRIVDLPADPLNFVEAVRSMPWPFFAAKSAEDGRRSELQEQQARRTHEASRVTNREGFLRSLGGEFAFDVDVLADASRIAQLHAKTNQFNLNPIRHGETTIREAMMHAGSSVVSLRYRDRFGDAGLVGAAVVRTEPERLSIDTLLLSCRVIGLGIELALLNAIVACAPPSVGIVRLTFRSTDRNAPAREFVESLPNSEIESGSVTLRREEVPPVPSWLRRAQPQFVGA